MYDIELTTITGSPVLQYQRSLVVPLLVDSTLQIVELERISDLQKNRVYEVVIMDGDGMSHSTLFSKPFSSEVIIVPWG